MSIAEWVSGVVAGIALVLTALTMRSDRRSRRRRDAELIYPLVSWHTSVDRTEESVEVEVSAYNGSPKPVFDITLALRDWNWKEHPDPLSTRHIPALSPGQQSAKAPFNTERLKIDPERLWNAPAVHIAFRVDEVQWLRTPDGVLHRWRRGRVLHRKGRWKREKA